MQVIDLTGENRGVVGFNVNLQPDGSVLGLFTVDKAIAPVTPGQPLPQGTDVIPGVQIQFDKPQSVAVFLHQLTKGYNAMSYRIMQEKARKDALAEAKSQEAEKKKVLAARIEQMARDLAVLQGEYNELHD